MISVSHQTLVAL